MVKRILLILLVLIIVIPALVLFLLYPGRAFDNLLSEPRTIPTEITSKDGMISLPDDWITNQALSMLIENQASLEPATLRGCGITCIEKGINAELGLILPLPVLGDFPLLVSALLTASIDNEVVLCLSKLRVGRLSIPGFLRRKALNIADENLGLNNLPLPVRYTFDPDKQELRLSSEGLLDPLLPGAELQSIETVEGAVNLHVSFPPVLEDQAEQVLRAVLADRTAFEKLLEEGLPENRTDVKETLARILDNAEAGISSSSGQSSMSILMPGLLELYGLSNTLAEKEKASFETSLGAYLKESPGVTNEIDRLLLVTGADEYQQELRNMIR